MATSRFILIDDDYNNVRSIQNWHEEGQARFWKNRGPSLPPLELWTTTQAIDSIRGRPGAGDRRTIRPHQWDGTECLLIDCWDRDAVDVPVNSFQSTFFALDLLAAIRDRKEAGEEVPRVVAYSRAMRDELVRAALGEFTQRRIGVRIDRDGVTVGKRLELSPEPFSEVGVLWGMFERDSLPDHLLSIADGDRTGSLAPPPPASVVWDEFLPNSCLASFHNGLRDRFPDVWRTCVLGDEMQANRATTKGVRRLGLQYLEPNPARGRPSWKGYVEIARRLADPQ